MENEKKVSKWQGKEQFICGCKQLTFSMCSSVAYAVMPNGMTNALQNLSLDLFLNLTNSQKSFIHNRAEQCQWMPDQIRRLTAGLHQCYIHYWPFKRKHYLIIQKIIRSKNKSQINTKKTNISPIDLERITARLYLRDHLFKRLHGSRGCRHFCQLSTDIGSNRLSHHKH